LPGIRRDHRVDGLSIRALADKYGVHRRTVRPALESGDPAAAEEQAADRAAVRAVQARDRRHVAQRSGCAQKQRHTARRILARLVDEHGAAGLSYSTVRDHVRKRRPQILAEAGRPLELGYVPQTHEPAAEAEVDFHDLWVVLRGVKTKTALFTMRLSYSGRAAHKSFLTQGQEAFLEGHVYALQRLGGVPVDNVRYDTSTARLSRSCSGAPGRRTSAGLRSNRTMGWKPDIASQDLRAVTRRAAWRARAAVFAETTVSQCQWWTRSTSSTPCWRPLMTPTTLAASVTAPTVLATIGRSKRRCCGHCRPSRSTHR
jgi:DNA-binding transcriptional regulator YhcF (GntR family)